MLFQKFGQTGLYLDKVVAGKDYEVWQKAFKAFKRSFLNRALIKRPREVIAIFIRSFDLFWQCFGSPRGANLSLRNLSEDQLIMVGVFLRNLVKHNFIMSSYIHEAGKKLDIKKWIWIQRSRGLWCRIAGPGRSFFLNIIHFNHIDTAGMEVEEIRIVLANAKIELGNLIYGAYVSKGSKILTLFSNEE